MSQENFSKTQGLPAGSTQSRPALSIRRSLKGEESSNMLEIMQGDVGMQRPPQVQHKRVLKMGRTISERGDICQWIKPMTQQAPPPTPVSVAASTSKDSTLGASASKAATLDVTHNATLNQDQHHNVMVRDLMPEAKRDQSTSDEECLSYEEQLKSIRHQQMKLLEQEKALHNKFEQREAQALEDKQEKQAIQEAATAAAASVASVTVAEQELVKCSTDEVEGGQKGTSNTTVSGLSVMSGASGESRRRRLKGSLASSYARRDEGTLGSLLWHCGEEEQAPRSGSSLTQCQSITRHANLKQENSSSIAHLLSQTNIGDCHESESAATCTVTQSISRVEDSQM